MLVWNPAFDVIIILATGNGHFSKYWRKASRMISTHPIVQESNTHIPTAWRAALGCGGPKM